MGTPNLFPVDQKCRWLGLEVDVSSGQSCGTKPVALESCAHSRQSVSEWSSVAGRPVGVHQKRKNCLVWKNSHICCQK